MMAKKMFQGCPQSLLFEMFPLLGYQSTIPHTDGTEHLEFFVCWRMPEDRTFDVGRNPHHVSSPVLLKVTLIETPEVKLLSSHEPTKLFYMSPAPPDWLLRLVPAARVGENQIDGKDVDIVLPLPLNQTLGLNGGATRYYPPVHEYTQNWWKVFINRPLGAYADGNAKRKAVLSPRHRSALPCLPLNNTGANTGWCKGNELIGFPVHRCSYLSKARTMP